MKKFDAIIIGTGQSGKPLAVALADKGRKVAVVEERFVGGTCINYGCTPTKAMVASAKAAYMAEHGKEWGVNTGKVKVDFAAVMKRKDKIVKDFRAGGEKQLEGNKNITLIRGTGSFAESNVIRVTSGKNEQLLTTKHIFIDTGAKPVIPNIPGINTVDYLNSESILNLKKLPKHLVIIGGGYIALEFAQMFRRFGSKVAVLEFSPRFLPKEDEDIAQEVKNILGGEGITIHTGANTNSITKTKSGIKLSVTIGKKKLNINGTHLLAAVGIKPASERLNLTAAGIKTDERGFIKVNSRLETNVKGIYALGDVKGGPAFTHISYDDYRIVYNNLFSKTKRTMANRPLPYVLFTDPELGRIGLTEQDALKQGYNILTAAMPMTYVARAIEGGETRGMMKVVVEKKSGKILGAAVLGMYGGELMSMFQLAMMNGIHYSKLQNAVFAHPTLSESLNNIFGKLK